MNTCYVELTVRQVLSNALKLKKNVIILKVLAVCFTSVSVIKCDSMVINDTVKVHTRCRISTKEEAINVSGRGMHRKQVRKVIKGFLKEKFFNLGF